MWCWWWFKPLAPLYFWSIRLIAISYFRRYWTMTKHRATSYTQGRCSLPQSRGNCYQVHHTICDARSTKKPPTVNQKTSSTGTLDLVYLLVAVLLARICLIIPFPPAPAFLLDSHSLFQESLCAPVTQLSLAWSASCFSATSGNKALAIL